MIQTKENNLDSIYNISVFSTKNMKSIFILLCYSAKQVSRLFLNQFFSCWQWNRNCTHLLLVSVQYQVKEITITDKENKYGRIYKAGIPTNLTERVIIIYKTWKISYSHTEQYCRQSVSEVPNWRDVVARENPFCT